MNTLLGERKLVTICMPVYNGAGFVHSSVSSLLSQSYRNLEVIVVDDGSTDGTLDILSSFKDSRLKIIPNDENAGNLTRRNQAFEAATGDYIAIMDADDLCRHDRVERQVAALKRGYELCGSFAASGQSPAKVERVWRLPQRGPELVRSALFGSPMANPSVMMTRELLERMNFRFKLDFFPAADYEAWARLIFKERVPTYIVPSPLIFRRVHGASITHTKARKMAQQADEVRRSLLVDLDVPADLIALHNRAVNGSVEAEEIEQLRHLHTELLPRAMPDVFSSGTVYYRHNDARITLGDVKTTKRSAPNVSVIVPAYNVGEMLVECVSSVVETNSEGVEVIIVDDGSTDDTPEICDRLAEKHPGRVRVVHQENGGLSAARNTGVAKSQAAYIFFLDGDDFMASEAIDMLYEEAVRTRADVVVSTHLAYFEDTRRTDPRHHVTETKLYANGVFEAFAQRKFGYIAANKLIRRELASDVPFRPGIYHEDELFCPELFLKAKRVATLAKDLYYYRQREGSITSNVTQKHIRDWVFIAESVLEIGFQYGLNTATSEGYSSLMNYLFMAARNKLAKLEDTSDTFDAEIHASISQLEARMTQVCGVNDPMARPKAANDGAKQKEKADHRRNWGELQRIQSMLGKLARATDTKRSTAG